MTQAEIVATLTEALQRELLEVARLERCEKPDDFTDMLFTIQDDLSTLADRCNVMNQDITTAETYRQVVMKRRQARDTANTIRRMTEEKNEQ